MSNNNEKLAEYQREYRKRYPDRCRSYYTKYRETHREKFNEIRRNWNAKNRDKSRASAAKNYRTNNNRFKLIEILGSKCSSPKCLVPGGCEDIRCLQLDHVNGGGCKDLVKFKYPSTMYNYYIRHLDEAKSTLQVLCANCNWIKVHEKQEYKIYKVLGSSLT